MGKLLLAILFFCLFTSYQLSTVGCQVIFAQGPKEKEAFLVARKAFDDGFYEACEELLGRFVKKYPSSDSLREADLLIGQCYFYRNKSSEALAKFEGILNDTKSDKYWDSALYWTGEAHFRNNDYDKAIGYYQKLIKEYPRSYYAASGYYSLGWCFFQKQLYQEALKNFESAQLFSSKDNLTQDSAYKIIECLYNLKNYAGLKKEAASYIKRYPRDKAKLAYLYFYSAEADYYLGDFEKSISGYSKVITANPDEKIRELAKIGMGWAFIKTKQYQKAKESFSGIKTNEIEKRSIDSLLLGEALLYYYTGQLNQAKTAYKQLITATPENPVIFQAYLGLADTLFAMADYKEAENTYRQAFKRIPRPATESTINNLHYAIASCLLKEGKLQKAISQLQAIINKSKDTTTKILAMSRLADAYQDYGEYEKAIQIYDLILKDFPGVIDQYYIHYRIGLAYFNQGDYQKSKGIFESFLREYKENNLKPQAIYLLGSSLYNMGEFSKAIDVLKDVLRYASQDTETTQMAEYEIADSIYQVGNEKEAITRFKYLRSKYPNSNVTPRILWWLAQYYYSKDDLTMAYRYFLSLVQDYPQSPLAVSGYYAIGSIYTREGKYEEAIEYFNRVAEFNKPETTPDAILAIANIKNILKKYAEAIQLYRQYLSMSPQANQADIYFRIAEALEAQNKNNQAIEEYLRIPQIAGVNQKLAVKSLLRAANIYENKEEFNKAIEIYNKIIAMGAEEAKYAQERIKSIQSNTKGG